MKATIDAYIGALLASVIFEPNDDRTRANLSNHIREYFESLVSNADIKSYNLICDETNNTPEIIAANSLVVDYSIVGADGQSFNSTGTVSRANPKISVA